MQTRIYFAAIVRVCAVFFAAANAAGSANAYITFGQGFSSKWGDDPQFGTGAVITWGYMLDGTPADPSLDAYAQINGTSQLGELRSRIDAAFGVGAFDAAIQNAFYTWSAVANVRFVGPIADSGLPAGQQGATTPDIRIGAFHPVSGSEFGTFAAIGYGPPGIVTPQNDFPESGDIFFNLDTNFRIATGTEDVTPLGLGLGNDVENLFLHELGHAAIGLGHPPWAGEDPDQRVMYVGGGPGTPFCCLTVNHVPHADDIAGAQYVYGIRGDYNRDRHVDAADYVAWRKSAGQSVTRGTGADGDLDGDIDVADWDAWRAHFGNAALAGFGEQMWPPATTVPEPSAMVMVLIWVLFAAPYLAGIAKRNVYCAFVTRFVEDGQNSAPYFWPSSMQDLDLA